MAATENFALPLPQMGEPADIRVLNRGTEEIDGIMNGNRTMFAPAWVNTETYHVGSRVVYLGEYYVCKADNVTGAWDATKWDHKTVGEDIEDSTGGASALADLDDVEITSPTQGQALVYDDTDDIWKNATLPEPVDVEANPSASSTATLSKLKVGSTVYGVSGLPSTSSASNGDVLTLGSGKTPTWAAPAVGGDGVTINTSTVITSGNIAAYGALNYTATQDCFVAFSVNPKSGYTTYIKINNVTIKSFYGNFGNSDGLPYEDCIFLKTGQALYVNNIANYQGSYHVYGVQEINSAVVAQLNAMKTGFDGVEYSSPAAMVQGCDNVLLEEIERVETATCNTTYGWVDYPVSATISNGYVTNTGVESSSSDYRKTNKISVQPGQMVSVSGVTNLRYWAWYNGDTFVSGDEYSKERIVPENVNGVIVSASISQISTTISVTIKKNEPISTENNALESGSVLNILNPSEVVEGKWMKPDGSTGNGSYTYTGMMEVSPGDVVLAWYATAEAQINQMALSWVVAYDSSKTIVPASGASSQAWTYTVPAGIKYVRVTLNQATLPNNSMISKHGEYIPYVPYENVITAKGGHEQAYSDWHRKHEFLSDIPVYVLNNLAYKPIGEIKNPYICLTCDDGLSMLASYTIPMFISKGVPLTMFMWPTSEVLTDASMLATVKAAIEDHEFCASMHGQSAWTGLSEAYLNYEMDASMAAFNDLEIPIHGASYPGHNIDPLVSAYIGGRFKVARNGYDGVGDNSEGLVIRAPYYINTGKCNQYALTSCSIVDGDLDMHKSAVDYVVEHGGIVMRHWHDNATELTEANKTKLEGLIDYGIAQGVTFITIKDIITSNVI